MIFAWTVKVGYMGCNDKPWTVMVGYMDCNDICMDCIG